MSGWAPLTRKPKATGSSSSRKDIRTCAILNGLRGSRMVERTRTAWPFIPRHTCGTTCPAISMDTLCVANMWASAAFKRLNF